MKAKAQRVSLVARLGGPNREQAAFSCRDDGMNFVWALALESLRGEEGLKNCEAPIYKNQFSNWSPGM